jgi:hypothetical protein
LERIVDLARSPWNPLYALLQRPKQAVLHVLPRRPAFSYLEMSSGRSRS